MDHRQGDRPFPQDAAARSRRDGACHRSTGTELMFVTFLLIFRESLEAFLLVGILLAYLARMGERRRWIWIFLGVIAGLLGSVVAAFVLQVLVDQFSDQYYRTLLTAAIMLIAMVILTYMAVWMGKQSRDHTADAKRKLEAHV
ncbi:hypothetical protein FGG78_22035, partial [Thioclava sp. BHET1]